MASVPLVRPFLPRSRRPKGRRTLSFLSRCLLSQCHFVFRACSHPVHHLSLIGIYLTAMIAEMHHLQKSARCCSDDSRPNACSYRSIHPPPTLFPTILTPSPFDPPLDPQSSSRQITIPSILCRAPPRPNAVPHISLLDVRYVHHPKHLISFRQRLPFLTSRLPFWAISDTITPLVCS